MIPVFEPVIGEEEIANVVDALRKGEISGSFGDYIPAFETAFADYVGVKHGIAVTSGTTALHLATSAAEIGEGDEVLVSASTNIATALGVFHNGGITVPVDSEPDTWNLDVSLLPKLVTDRTKAIFPVHLFGHPVDMDAVMEFANAHDLIVIEDCAEAHGAMARDRMVGSFGHMACYSFYANKIMTTGEGGMIVTNDDALADKLRLLRNLAFTQPRFKHEFAGYNFRMTGYQAAMGLAQLKKLDQIIENKRQMAARYNKHLAGISGLQLPIELDWAKHVYWMYSVVVTPEFGMTRDALCAALRERGVDTRTFFCPMNQQPCLQDQLASRNIDCPVADNLWQNGFYLPSSTHLTEDEIQTIATTIKDIRV